MPQICRFIFSSNVARLKHNRTGVSAVLFALVLPIILGFVAMGTEVGLWYLERRNIQTAADVAAMSAGFEALYGTGNEQSAAEESAAEHDIDTANGDTVTVNVPPFSGQWAGVPDLVEVIITKKQPLLFSSFFLDEPLTLSARAVARYISDSEACVLALDTSAARAIDVAGTANLAMSTCILATNSTNAQAVSIRGNASVKALSLTTAGDYKVSGSGSLASITPPKTGAPSFPDPYADRTVPTTSTCDYNAFSASSAATINPGTYCNGFSVGSQADVNLTPGTYVIKSGAMTVNGQAKVQCSTCTGTAGVTFVLTGTGSDYATVTINGGATMTLKAPSTGPYAGLLFFQDQAAPTGGTNTINGGSNMNLTGALYFPRQLVEFSGNSSFGAGCTQIVSRLVSFTGTGNLNNVCDDAGTEPIFADGIVRLLE